MDVFRWIVGYLYNVGLQVEKGIIYVGKVVMSIKICKECGKGNTNYQSHEFFLGITKVRQYVCMWVCMWVCMYVCLCDYSHTVQPRTFKFWHNIPYVKI